MLEKDPYKCDADMAFDREGAVGFVNGWYLRAFILKLGQAIYLPFSNISREV